MASVTGKWKLVKSENFEDYHNAIHSTDDYKDRLRKLAAEFKKNPDCYVEELTYDGSEGTLRRVLFVNGESKRDIKHKVGSTNEATTADGRKAQITLTVESDSRIVVHEKGEGFEVNGFAEASGSDLTLSLTGNGVTTVQSYTRV